MGIDQQISGYPTIRIQALDCCTLKRQFLRHREQVATAGHGRAHDRSHLAATGLSAQRGLRSGASQLLYTFLQRQAVGSYRRGRVSLTTVR